MPGSSGGSGKDIVELGSGRRECRKVGETHLGGGKGLILIGLWLLAKVCLKSRWATRREKLK